MPTITEAARLRQTPVAMLGAMLALRGCINAAFGVWLLSGHPSWTRVFQIGSLYAIADGALGLIAVGLIVSLAPSGLLRVLAAITTVDAVGRIAAGIAVRALPGLPHLPMAIVPFFAAIGAVVAGLGAISLTAWIVARARTWREWSKNAEALFDPIGVAALISLSIGFVLFTNPPATIESLRAEAATATGALAIVFLTASLGALIHRRTS